MAKPNDIVFTGLFINRMLGTFSVLRGYAPLGDLARVSVPFGMTKTGENGRVQGHQRELDERHSEEIKQYLESNATQRFLPEVILSVRAGISFANDEGIATATPTGNHADLEAMAGFTIKTLTAPRTAQYDVRQLTVQGDLLDQIRQRNIIRRVDGNHRLEKALDIEDDPSSSKRYVAPFCMVFLSAPEQEVDNYTESMIFHTINSTAIPLQSEHALSLILGQDPGNALPEEAEYRLNPALHLTRLLHDQLQTAAQGVKQRLGNKNLTSFYQAAKSMVEVDPPQFHSAAEQRTFSEGLFSGLSDLVTQIEPDNPALCRAPYFLDLAARVWQLTEAEDKDHNAHVARAREYFVGLGAWLGRDGFDRLEEGKTLSGQLLDVYQSVRRHIPTKVFLARWYPQPADGDHKIYADNRYKQYDEVVKAVAKKQKVSLELIDMGTETGSTKLIPEKMYQAIADAQIVLVDLTGVRPNVCIEAGYALKHHESNRLIFLFHDGIGSPSVPFDLRDYTYLPFKDTGQIADMLTPNLVKVLEQAGLVVPSGI